MAEKLKSYAIISIGDLKGDLDITGTEFDDRLTRIINGVTDAIEKHCNRYFKQRTLTSEKIDGDGTDTLLLNMPVISISSVTNDTISVTSSDYALYKKTGELVLTNGSVWTDGRQKVTITYTYGYSDADMPSSIQTAARLWCIQLFHAIKDDRVGVTNRTEADQSISYDTSRMPQEVADLLSNFKISRFGG